MTKKRRFVSVLIAIAIITSWCLPVNARIMQQHEAEIASLEKLLAVQLNNLEISENSLSTTDGIADDAGSMDNNTAEGQEDIDELTNEISEDVVDNEIDSPSSTEEIQEEEMDTAGHQTTYLQSIKDRKSKEPNTMMTLMSAPYYISNEYIAIQVNPGGYINMGTTGGNPETDSDNNAHLLYGWPDSRTSFTTIRIDNEDYIFVTDNIINTDNAITASMDFIDKGIIVEQICSFDANPVTGRNDMAKIEYRIINNDTESHDVGVRIMLDTMLGRNDGAPFKIAGYGDITTEVEMTGTRIPQYWQAFDNLDNPSVVANGMLYKTFNERPDKVQFAYWSDIYDTLWDYQVTDGYPLTSDSAVGIYYNPKTVRPNSDLSLATYYGLGDLGASGGNEDLSVVVTAPPVLEVNAAVGNYYSNPFTVTCYIKNNGTELIQNAIAELNLPASGELSLSSPARKINIGDIPPQGEKTISYSVLASSQSEEKFLNYSISVSADNCETVEVSKSIVLPAVTTVDASITLDRTSLALEVGQSDTLHATLTNITGQVTWLSNKPSVAKVDSYGNIIAVSPGTAIITASVAGKSASCVVTVSGSPVALNSISIAPGELILNLGESKTLNVSYSPSNASNRQIRSWTSSRPDIASVSGGRVTAKSVGTAVITAVSQDGNKQASCTVTVVEPDPTLSFGEGISFNQNVPGPSINFAGKQWPLFRINVGTELKLGDSVKLVYNPQNGKYVAYFGDMHEETGTNDLNPDGTLTEGAKQLRRDTYARIKSLMAMVGRQTNRDFYNSYRRFISKSSPWSVNGNKTVFGYVEFAYTNGRYVLTEGEVCVLFEAGVSFKYNFPPAPVVYLKFGISGSLQTGLKLELKTSGVLNSGVNVYGRVEGQIKPSLGIGGDIWVAEVEGGIEGSIKSVIQLPLNSEFTPHRDLEVSLSGELYLKYKAFLFINGKHTYPFVEWKIYPQQSPRANALLTINEESMVPISRDYMGSTRFAANERLARISALSGVNMNSNLETTNVMINTYPYGQPQIIEIDNNKYLLVFIGDVESRTAENRTGLYYSIYNGERWSVPELVYDDGTSDFSPALAKCGHDIYVVWQNIEKVLDEGAELDEYSRNSGIMVSKLNGETFDAVQYITESDGMLDKAPVVAANNENISIVWIKNTENDAFGLEGVNSIYRATLSEGVWNSSLIVDDAGLIGNLTSAYDRNENVVAYTKDTDGNIDTMEDTEIMLIKGSEAPIAITDNEVADNNPVLAGANGDASLYWSSENKIYYSESIDAFNPMEAGEYSGENFRVLTNRNMKVIIWEQSMGFASELYGMFYENGQWGAPVQLTDAGRRIRETSGFLKDDGTIYLTYMSAVINEREPGADTDPTGETSLVVSRLTPSCNLGFGSSIAFDVSQVRPNNTLTLSAYVENSGQASSPGFTVSLGNDSGTISTVTFNIALAPGEGTYIDIPYNLPAEIVKHRLTLTLEPLEAGDYDISDNTAEAIIGDAVIEIQKPVISGMGNSRTVAATITNGGYAASGPLAVSLYANPGAAPVASQEVASVPGQSSRLVEFTLPINEGSFDNGDFLIYVGVDDGDNEIFSSAVVEAPDRGSSVTISNAAQVGNVVIFNVDNNQAEDISGIILISSKDDYDNQVSQTISMAGLESRSIQLDITPLEEDEALTIRILDYSGNVISNIVNVVCNGGMQVDAPTAIPAAGTYTNSVMVTLYCPDPEARIIYTVDGSEPSLTNGLLYTQAFTISRTTTVKAISVKDGMADSDVISVTYTIKTPDSSGGQSGGSYTPAHSDGVDWDRVINDINASKSGDTVVVSMKGETLVPVKVLQALKGKDVWLKLDMSKYTWTINGKDIADLPSSGKNINLRLTIINNSALSTISEEKDIIQIELAHEGTLPFAAILELSVDSIYAGSRVILYHYNESRKKLVDGRVGVVDADGKVSFKLNHASKYVLTKEALAGTIVADNTVKIPDGRANTMVPYCQADGNDVIIPMSTATENSIMFMAPQTAQYDYKNNAKYFVDIAGHWSKDNIDFVTARELFSGIGSNIFDAEGKMTRAMFVTVLGRFHGVNASLFSNKPLFRDVDTDAWYAPYVAWAYENKIVAGVGDNRFAPEKAITREEMAVILANYAEFAKFDLPEVSQEISFSDLDEISDWAVDDVKLIQRAGIINGKSGGIFDPKGEASRAEVAAVLRRFIEAVLKNPEY